MSALIGEKTVRAWLNVRVALVHDDKLSHDPRTQVIHFPSGNFLVRMIGQRSDGIICEAMAVLKPEDVTKHENISKALVEVGRFFETYLDCSCTHQQRCPKHANVPLSRHTA